VAEFTAPIVRKETARGHHYVDAVGRRVPGVTTIIGDGVPKPALINWAANTTADYAVDKWAELTEMPASKRLDRLKKARYEEKDAAANKGTAVHLIGEKLVKGEEVQVPDELAGHAESYARFLDEFEVQPIYVEFTVISYRYGYAGTGDLIASVKMPSGERRTLLLDLKTNRSGIFGETSLQIAAYRFADVLIPAGKTAEQPMPEVEGCGAVHVRSDGCSLIPLTAEVEQHRSFLYAKEVGRFVKDSRDLVGAAVQPPTTSTYRLVRGDS
jgi:hypothetical protein